MSTSQLSLLPLDQISEFRKMPESAFWVFVVYNGHANSKDGRAWPSFDTVAEIIGYQVDTVAKFYRWLVKNGWLRDLGRRVGKAKVVEVVMAGRSVRFNRQKPDGASDPFFIEEQTTKKEQTTPEPQAPEVSSAPSADGRGDVKQSCCSLLASPEKKKALPTPVIELPTAFAALESGAKNIIRGLKLEEASRILVVAAKKIEAGGVRNPLGYLASLRTALMEGRFFDAEAIREKEAAEEAEKKRRWKQFEIGLEMAELEDERIATEAVEAEHIKVQEVLDTKCEEELIEMKARFVEGLETIKRTKRGNVFSANRALKAIEEGDWGARMVRTLWSGYVAEYG